MSRPGAAGALRALDHAIVLVDDLGAAAADWSRLLGRAPSWRGAHPDLGTANVLFRLDDVYLELLSPVGRDGLAGALRARLDARGEGPLGLAFATDDAAACAAALRARGLAVADPVPGEGHEEASGAVRRWRRVMLPGDAARGVLVFAIAHEGPDALPLAAITADPSAAAVHAVDHVVIRTDAPEAAIGFYGERLGLRLALDRTFPQWGMRLLFFRLSGITVEVAAPATPSETPSAEDGLWGISWRVGDLEAARARLVADGFDVSELRTGRRPGTRVCTVRAPTHGVATLLLETKG